MDADFQIWIAVIAVFCAVAGLAAIIGFQFEKRRRLQTRLAGGRDSFGASGEAPYASQRLVDSFDERFFAGLVSEEQRSKLRVELVRAGYFSPAAPGIFVAAQAAASVLAPFCGYALTSLLAPKMGAGLILLVLCTLAYAGYLAPDFYIKRRTAALAADYRSVFPDFLDLLVVCIDAGLSLNAALDRVSCEFTDRCRPLAMNLAVLLSEIRSGRATVDALDNLCGRLAIEEARSFSTLIKQSLELGSDVSSAMRVYADEMRAKRILRAEEAANALPVKMLLPLGFCIFPVILIVILTPTLIRIYGALKQVVGG